MSCKALAPWSTETGGGAERITAERRTTRTDARNGRKSAAGQTIDPYPNVKLFTPTPTPPATWLLTELDPADEDIAGR